VKVSSSVSSVGGSSESGAARPAAGGTARAGTPQQPATDQVDLSPLSSRIQEIEASLASSPVVNAERVSAIKQAIAEGRFQINPERIADGLLKSVRQMLDKQKA
jgi:negative regulator of flagellin synthesis FlgM